MLIIKEKNEVTYGVSETSKSPYRTKICIIFTMLMYLSIELAKINLRMKFKQAIKLTPVVIY
jgi:hypothetical protein